MEPEIREAFTAVYGRVNKTDEALLNLTKQMSELVGIHKAQADAKAAEKPQPSFVVQCLWRAGFQMVTIALVALLAYAWTHGSHGH